VRKAKKRPFSVQEFLNIMDGGRTQASFRKNQKVYAQGDPADSVFYVREGKLKVVVVSEQGKEAVVALHGEGDFFGEGCLTGQPLRLGMVCALTNCTVTRIDKAAMIAALREEPKVSEMFIAYTWLATPGWKKTWSINFSIRARSDLRGFFC
jgi:CRP/FNR family transcriptional regulator, cyclic AMP receptor protein